MTIPIGTDLQTYGNTVMGGIPVLKNDKRLIVSAAGKAEKAVEMNLEKATEVRTD